MKRLLVLLLALMLICFTACGADECSGNEKQEDQPITDIVLPPFEATDRELVSFENITYSFPDADAVITKSAELLSLVKSDEIEYDALVKMIYEIDGIYEELNTMSSLLMIKTSNDLSDTASNDDYTLLNSKIPSVKRSIDEMLVELARSKWAERLEDEVFGKGFIEEYFSGSRFNDYITSLLEEEEALKSEYFTLGKDEAAERGADIFIELLKVRRKLSDAYGDDSYATYAYEALGHDYSPEDILEFTEDISAFAYPIYTSLSQRAFSGYFKTHRAPTAYRAEIINDLYTVLSELDEDFGEVYSYMLNGSLYDIEPRSDTRRDGAFTVYLSSYEVPFIFATLNGTVSDHVTISHEFGHFYDEFENYGNATSLDLCELSSQAMEMLTLTKFKGVLNNDEYKYLYYNQMKSALETLIIQGFYARFEAFAYDLKYDEISREALDGLVMRAAKDMNLNIEVFNDLSDAVIIQLIDSPFYLQSYCTSLIASLDIFFTECDEEGRGVEAYKTLLDRDSDESFTEALKRADIASPFDEDIVKKLADEIHYSILGLHYYSNKAKNTKNAA